MGELKNSVLIVREIMLYSEEIYTAGKNFTQPPVMAVATNFKSGLNNINQ